MTPTLVRQRPRTETRPQGRAYATRARGPLEPTAPGGTEASRRARDWAEIQERMLVPLFEAVHERLEVGPSTRLLGLECGSGLALLLAAARGACATGVDTDRARLALARERTAALSSDGPSRPGGPAVTLCADGTPGASGDPYDVITAFQPIGRVEGDGEALGGTGGALGDAVGLLRRGGAVVLTAWGPPERCAASPVLRLADRADRADRAEQGEDRPAPPDSLERLADRAGLRPDGSGRVVCPFGYADRASAVRGLLSTGPYGGGMGGAGTGAVGTGAWSTAPTPLEREVATALEPHTRPDGTVWLRNVFRYLIARTR
ncbi:SAM-dependent methyltransferase [Streptomyces sp. NPDC057638]|uniref:SAM-dependent methyltransferase n=1 Tax=Streptomyces sp. NPDC057638 TaxID=3346190 RepID=UPI00369D219D